jgi:hypothetical protein
MFDVPSSRFTSTLRATRGERLALNFHAFAGEVAGGGGPLAMDDHLTLHEVDGEGRIVAIVLFDLDAEDAAHAEPDVANVVAPIAEVIDAFNEKSAAKWRAAFTDDLVVEDHRLAGMGRIEGADAYTESVVALWKLAPVTRGEMGWRWPALDRHGAITVVHRKGTVPDGGGDFESEYLYLYLVAQGRIARIEVFEMDALDKALARFEELRPQSSGTT